VAGIHEEAVLEERSSDTDGRSAPDPIASGRPQHYGGDVGTQAGIEVVGAAIERETER
jgi:hypothetical protein